MFNYINNDLQVLPELDNSLFDTCPKRTVQIRKKIGKRTITHIDGILYVVSATGDYIESEETKITISDNTIILNEQVVKLEYEEEEIYEYSLKKINNKEQNLKFCEGKASQKEDNESGNKYWWCRNGRCYDACQSRHDSVNWRKFTLLDMIICLGLPFDEEEYFKFIGTLNRLEQLKEHLKCRECNHILRPSKQSNFSFYRTNLFKCTNKNCIEKEKNIYLSSCSNFKCMNVIDSRESVRCDYTSKGHPDKKGLYICKNCGGCCSKYQLDKRLKILRHELPVEKQRVDSSILRINYHIDNKLYHLENREFQCYQCNTIMVPRYGIGSSLYCKKCYVQYLREFLPEPRKDSLLSNKFRT